ncbi:MAG TPA: hypothetical protein PLG50_00260 [bacterium]|nr:hypothetical protein [bacterium]HQG44072.1 hypothetical protein [bacterium]HQI48743.1 hypothetical protein [bacterium]HQJ65230.1 hypothetical protein [bacterium]
MIDRQRADSFNRNAALYDAARPGYPDVLYRELLKPGGFVAAWWSNYSRDDAPVFDAIREIYARYHPKPELHDDLRGIQRQRIESIKCELEQAPGLDFFAHREYQIIRTFSAASYIDLLQTFSENAIHPPEQMAGFYERLTALIHDYSDRLEVPVMINLEVARSRIP